MCVCVFVWFAHNFFFYLSLDICRALLKIQLIDISLVSYECVCINAYEWFFNYFIHSNCWRSAVFEIYFIFCVDCSDRVIRSKYFCVRPLFPYSQKLIVCVFALSLSFIFHRQTRSLFSKKKNASSSYPLSDNVNLSLLYAATFWFASVLLRFPFWFSTISLRRFLSLFKCVCFSVFFFIIVIICGGL